MIGNLDDREFSEAVERIKEVNRVVSDLDPAIRSQASAALSPYVSDSTTAHLSQGLSPVDVNALVLWVLRASYLETQEDLREYAEKVKYFNAVKKHVREEKLRALVYKFSKDPLVYKFSKDIESLCATGEMDLQMITDRLSELMSALSDALVDEVLEDAQLADVDLQTVLQKQQQVLQEMSNISKMLHDTAMSIIRKVGGG
jgi:hypothetical protein